MPKLKKTILDPFQKLNDESCTDLTRKGLQPVASVRNLAKAAKLSQAKVREILSSKSLYITFTQATRKFEKMRAFARFICCMDLAYVDRLAEDSNGVKCLLVRQDLFDRTVDAKRMKNKDSKGTVKTFSKVITEENRPKKFG